jgi:hypothetical protein
MQVTEDKYKLVYDEQTLIYSASREKCEEVKQTLLTNESDRFKKELFTINQTL